MARGNPEDMIGLKGKMVDKMEETWWKLVEIGIGYLQEHGKK
jgi:hypothetical protein